jgi:hypothetical protein
MIVFASSITAPDKYERCAAPGIRLAAEPDTVVLPFQAAGSIYRSYNLILDQVAELDGLEALVLIHQDAEIVDAGFCRELRRALADPDVGLVGGVGAVDVRSIAWWEGSVTWASFNHRYEEMGGGELPGFTWDFDDRPPYAQLGEVDTVDGFALGLSPWVVRNVRFDESLGNLHGYDFDFCLQVREAGRKVVTADLRVMHHHSLELVSDPHTWVEAHMRIAEKWDGRMPFVGVAGGDWRERARRGEAEASLARTQAVAAMHQADARKAHLERQVEEMTGSISWRITEPLRLLNALRRSLRRTG